MDLTFQVPMQYCSLQHQTLVTLPSHPNWALFSLSLHLFILSGVISPLLSSSILSTYQPGEFIFQCHIFEFSYCSCVSQGKNTEVVSIPFSRAPRFVRTLHHEECSNYHTIALISHSSKVMVKFSEWGFNSTLTENFLMLELDLERSKNQRSNCQRPLDHRKFNKVPEKYLLLLYWLCQSLWLCGSQQTVENS